jgi:hypothetical protein
MHPVTSGALDLLAAYQLSKPGRGSLLATPRSASARAAALPGLRRINAVGMRTVPTSSVSSSIARAVLMIRVSSAHAANPTASRM